MHKRPQSAFTTQSGSAVQKQMVKKDRSIYDSSNQQKGNIIKSTSQIRPMSGFSDQSHFKKSNQTNFSYKSCFEEHLASRSIQAKVIQINQPLEHQPLDHLINQARYSLEFDLIDEAINYFNDALNSAVSNLSSLKFQELFGSVVKNLNFKAIKLIKAENRTSSEKIINNLLIYTQMKPSQNRNDFLQLVKCPVKYKQMVINTYGLLLLTSGKYEEAERNIFMGLKLLSAEKIEDQILEFQIGQSYLYLSTCALCRQNYLISIQYSSSALTHLQSFFLIIYQQNQNNDQILVSDDQEFEFQLSCDYISDGYINLAVGKEKTKQFQEAHFNYYSALNNAQQHLSQQRVQEIQLIYDKFLSRQAQFVQSLGSQIKYIPGRASHKSLGFNKISDIPQYDTDKMIFKNKVKRNKIKRQQQSIKFAPYYNNIYQNPPGYQNFEKKPIYNNLLMFNQKQRNLSNQSGIKQYKNSSSVKNFASSRYSSKKSQQIDQEFKPNLYEIPNDAENKQKVHMTAGELIQFYKGLEKKEYNENLKAQAVQNISSSAIRFLESILQNQEAVNDNNVLLLEDFQDIKLTQSEVDKQPNYSLRSMNSNLNSNSIFVGRLSIYLVKTKNILYMRYFAYEQSVIDQFSTQKKEYQYLLYAHSFNLSDISNEIYNKNEQNDSEEKKFALFLREFIIQVCKNIGVNKEKQSLQIKQNEDQSQSLKQGGQRQVCIQLPEQNQDITIHQKNHYESLVFLSNGFSTQELNQDDLKPLLLYTLESIQNKENSDEQIEPLIVNTINDQNNQSMDESEAATLIQRQFRRKQMERQKNALVKRQKTRMITRNPSKGRIDYDDAVDVFDIIEEAESQEKTATVSMYQNKLSTIEEQDLIRPLSPKSQDQETTKKRNTVSEIEVRNRVKQESNSVDMMSHKQLEGKQFSETRQQEKFTIQIASEDQTRKEVFEVYAKQDQQIPVENDYEMQFDNEND